MLLQSHRDCPQCPDHFYDDKPESKEPEDEEKPPGGDEVELEIPDKPGSGLSLIHI